MAALAPLIVDLTNQFRTLHVLFILNAVSALRSLLVFVFCKLSGRRFVFTTSVYLDICMISIFIYYLRCFYYYSSVSDMDPMFYGPGGLITDKNDRMNVFSFQMMYTADSKEFRFDWLSSIYAAFVCLKVITLF